MSDITSLDNLRNYFNSGVTQTYSFRKEQLKKLKSTILNHEQDIYDCIA